MLTYLSGNPASQPVDQVLHWHVGLPKTGTTLLQTVFYPHHDQIAYLGKFLPGQKFRNAEVDRLVMETTRQRVFRCDRSTARRLYERQVGSRLGQGKAVVLSMEDGSHGSPRRRRAKMANLRAVCGDCRLLITLRNPLRLVQSMYLQRLKKVNCHPPRWFAGPWMPDFHQWLESCDSRGEKAELSHLDYAGYIADWENTFGVESVEVLVFEQLKSHPQAYIDQVAAFFGVRSIDARQLAEAPPVNPSWTPQQIRRLRQIMDSRLATLGFRLSSRERRLKLLGVPGGPSARPPLAPHWHARICEFTRAGNRRLADRRHLPLAELGYPM
jgi:hypothetical protein